MLFICSNQHRGIQRAWLSRLLFPLALVVTNPIQANEVLDQAKTLLRQKNSEAAFQLLVPLERQRAGQPEYDYLLGVAAADLGHIKAAIGLLERVVQTKPFNGPARAELARAYVLAGDYPAARRQFAEALALNPSEKARRTIKRYQRGILIALKQAEPTRLSGFVELGGGFDSNANQASTLDRVAVPALGDVFFTLASTGRETASPVVSPRAGLRVDHRATPSIGLFANLDFGTNRFADGDAKPFNTRSMGISGGGRWTTGAHSVTATVRYQTLHLDKQAFRKTASVTGQWSYRLGPGTQVGGFVALGNLDYFPKPLQSARDIRQMTAGPSLSHTFEAPLRPQVFVAAYGGRDVTRESGVAHLGRDFYGVRLGGQLELNDSLVAYGILSAERSDYGGTDPLFLKNRDDRFWEVGLGIRQQLPSGFSIRAEVSHTDNQSNLELHEFKRTHGDVSLRWDFF